MDALVVVVAQWAVFLVLAGALAAWWRATPSGRFELVVGGVLAVVLVALAVKGASLLWNDPRPFVVDGQAPLFAHPDDNGFPSDHASFAAAVSGVVLAARRVWGLALLVVSALVGAARVAAHVHHVPDVIAGLLLGLACAAVAVALARVVVARVTARRELTPWGTPGRRVSGATTAEAP
ncbi:MAG: phosphatase PAP2 family protein [Lapillicoccus sp.]